MSAFQLPSVPQKFATPMDRLGNCWDLMSTGYPSTNDGSPIYHWDNSAWWLRSAPQDCTTLPITVSYLGLLPFSLSFPPLPYPCFCDHFPDNLPPPSPYLRVYCLSNLCYHRIFKDNSSCNMEGRLEGGRVVKECRETNKENIYKSSETC